MKPNRILIFLLSALTFSGAKAFPDKFLPVFPGRPYWYNPGALCYDSSHSVSLYSGLYLKDRDNPGNDFDPRIGQSWLNAEVRLPGRFGAIGGKLGYEDISPWKNYRMASLTYANGISAGKGRLSFGVQADMEHSRIIVWGTSERPSDIRTDMSAGIFYQRGPLMTGISARNLLRTPFTYRRSDTRQTATAHPRRAINLTGSYNFRIAKDWNLQTSALAEITLAKLNLQTNFTAIFKNMIQIGTSFSSYRINEITVNAGLQVGRANFFAIVPVPTNKVSFSDPEYRAGLSYRLSDHSK